MFPEEVQFSSGVRGHTEPGSRVSTRREYWDPVRSPSRRVGEYPVLPRGPLPLTSLHSLWTRSRSLSGCEVGDE